MTCLYVRARGGVLQNRCRTAGRWEDQLLCEREGRLRHLLFPTGTIGLLADICIHFCQDGHEVTTPAGKIKVSDCEITVD